MKNEDLISNLTGKLTSTVENASTHVVMKELVSKTCQNLILFHCKPDTILSVLASLNFEKEAFETYGLDPFSFHLYLGIPIKLFYTEVKKM